MCMEKFYEHGKILSSQNGLKDWKFLKALSMESFISVEETLQALRKSIAMKKFHRPEKFRKQGKTAYV